MPIDLDIDLMWKICGLITALAGGAWGVMSAKIGSVKKDVEKFKKEVRAQFEDVDEELETERQLAVTRTGNLHRRLDDLQRDLHDQQARTRDELKQDIALVLSALGMRRDHPNNPS